MRKEGRSAEAKACATAGRARARLSRRAFRAGRVELGNAAFGPAFTPSSRRSARRRRRPHRSRVFADLALAATIGIWIAFALFLVIALVRHTRFLAHDLRTPSTSTCPRGWRWRSRSALGFPILFGLRALPLLGGSRSCCGRDFSARTDRHRSGFSPSEC